MININDFMMWESCYYGGYSTATQSTYLNWLFANEYYRLKLEGKT